MEDGRAMHNASPAVVTDLLGNTDCMGCICHILFPYATVHWMKPVDGFPRPKVQEASRVSDVMKDRWRAYYVLRLINREWQAAVDLAVQEMRRAWFARAAAAQSAWILYEAIYVPKGYSLPERLAGSAPPFDISDADNLPNQGVVYLRMNTVLNAKLDCRFANKPPGTVVAMNERAEWLAVIPPCSLTGVGVVRITNTVRALRNIEVFHARWESTPGKFKGGAFVFNNTTQRWESDDGSPLPPTAAPCSSFYASRANSHGWQGTPDPAHLTRLQIEEVAGQDCVRNFLMRCVGV